MAKSKSSSNRNRKRELTPQEKVVEAFMGCPRCSFLLVGYKLIHDDFEEAVDQRDGNWLTLSWDHAVKRLIHKSYGIQIEMDAYYFEGSCLECHRPFIFEENGGDGRSGTLRIAVKNTKK